MWKLLGHRRLNSTMIHALVHDCTVTEDYYAAMTVVETRVGVVSANGDAMQTPEEEGRVELLDRVERLAKPLLSVEARLELVGQMRLVVDRCLPAAQAPPVFLLTG